KLEMMITHLCATTERQNDKELWGFPTSPASLPRRQISALVKEIADLVSQERARSIKEDDERDEELSRRITSEDVRCYTDPELTLLTVSLHGRVGCAPSR